MQILRRLMPALALFLILPSMARTQQPATGRSRIVCYTSYDSDYFYFAAVVNKPSLTGRQSSYFSNPKEDDSVAVYLQSEAVPTGDKRSAKSVEMAASVAGGVQLYRGANAVPLTKFDDFLIVPDGTPNGHKMPFKFGIGRKGTLNGAAAETNSYTVEMAIPWVELGGAPSVGQKMRFNVVAYSATPSTPHILSLSPAVKTEADIQNPLLWSEIVFVDAPVRSVASAPDAKVSARLFTAKPVIDGELEEGPWNTLTFFGFAEAAGGGTEVLAPNTGNARIRPKVLLKPARPPIQPTMPAGAPSVGIKDHVSQPLPRLVFTLYQYDFQNDQRKQAPFRPVRTPEGATQLSEHPLNGPGPWMTYDRVDWHRGQLDDIRRAGIDVILPIYRASASDKQHYAVRGLMTLAASLKQMHASGQDYPLVGMYLDTTTLADEKGEKLDLKTEQGQARFYAAIKDFFLLIPARYRVAIPLDPHNGGGDANVIVLSSAAPFADLSNEFVSRCRASFRQEFGADLLILGSPDFKGKASLDGYVTNTHGKGFQMDEAGWIKAAAVGPGYDPFGPSVDPKAIRRREEGDAYRRDWKQALAKQPAWVFVDGWNDFEDGAEIAPSFQHGVEYVDLTRIFGHAFRSAGTALRASYLSNNVPKAAVAGSTTNVLIRVANAGAGLWTAETYSLLYQWQAASGQRQAPVHVPFTENLVAAQAVTVPIALKLPTEPGMYTLIVDVAQVTKKGDVTALLSGLGSQKLELPVQVVPASDSELGTRNSELKSLPDYAVTVVSNDLTTTAETGGTYVAKAVLRNDGSKTWRSASSTSKSTSKGGGGRIIARLWRFVSSINGTGEKESLDPVTMADAGSDISADVPPGGVTTISIPVTFSAADKDGGTPVRAWSQADNWNYQLRWEYSADENGRAGCVSDPEPLALVDVDFGVQFTQDSTLLQLGGDRTLPVKVGLRNVGPQTWAKGSARVGAHWYYLDGTEAIWQDQTTPLPQEIEPGGEVNDLLAYVAVPPFDGTYWLVWDVKIGDTWGSTLPSVRSGETLVRRVEVVNGKLVLVDLTPSYNLDGVAEDGRRTADAQNPKSKIQSIKTATEGFDASGRSFPAEIVPPYATIDAAPVGMWLGHQRLGSVGSASIDSPRKISFRWGPKGDNAKNLIQCLGQKVAVGSGSGQRRTAMVARAVHFLAAASASTKADVIGSFILLFEDGTEQLTSFPLSRWDAPPTHGEEVAFFCRYSRSRTGSSSVDDPQKPVALFHYVIKVSEKKKLVAIQMPNAPDIKIAGITLEK